MISFEDATVETVIKYLKQRGREGGPISFCVMSSDYFLSTHQTERGEPLITLYERDILLRDVVDMICEETELWWTVGPCDGVPCWTEPVADSDASQ